MNMNFSNHNNADRDIIVYVGGFELPDRNAAAQRVLANSWLLRDLGYRVVLIGMNKQATPGTGIVRDNHPGIEFDCWSMPYPASGMDWLRYISSAGPIRDLVERHYANRLFATISYNFPALAQNDLRKWSRRNGAAAIAEVTEWYGKTRIRSLSALVKNLDVPLRMRLINKWMDGLITTSPFLTRYYRTSVRNLVELPGLFDWPDAKPSDSGQRRPGPVRLFFAGTGFDAASVKLSKDGLKDRLDWVLDVLSLAHQRGSAFEFDIFGVNESDYLALVPDHADKLLAMASKLRFHGRQPRPSVIKALVDADFSIFLRASNIVTEAGFPTKFAESITFGTPVLTNRMDNIAPYMREGQTGFYLDAENLAAAAESLAMVLSMDRQAIGAMKEHCLRSGIFNYRNFTQPVQEFIAAMQRGHVDA